MMYRRGTQCGPRDGCQPQQKDGHNAKRQRSRAHLAHVTARILATTGNQGKMPTPTTSCQREAGSPPLLLELPERSPKRAAITTVPRSSSESSTGAKRPAAIFRLPLCLPCRLLQILQYTQMHGLLTTAEVCVEVLGRLATCTPTKARETAMHSGSVNFRARCLLGNCTVFDGDVIILFLNCTEEQVLLLRHICKLRKLQTALLLNIHMLFALGGELQAPGETGLWARCALASVVITMLG